MRMVVLAALWSACAVPELTEVVVIVEAEPVVRARSESLAVKVATAPSDGASMVLLDNSNTPWSDGRYTVALSPRDAKVASRYVVEASALEGGLPIATARLISGFVRGQTRYVRLLLEDQCVGMLACGEGSTCRAGACVDARIDPTELSPDGDFVPVDDELSPVTDAAAEAAVPARDAGPARDAAPASVDAGPRRDAMPRADAAPVSAPDAGPTPSASPPCSPGYYEGSFAGSYTYSAIGLETTTTIESSSTFAGAPVVALQLSADGPSRLRIETSCVTSTMVSTTSRRPFLARMTGGLDCATGKLSATLEGHYLLFDNTDVFYNFAGPVAAQLDPMANSLEDGTWSVSEPNTAIEDFNDGSGQGSWRVAFKSAAAPALQEDPCAEVDELKPPP